MEKVSPNDWIIKLYFLNMVGEPVVKWATILIM